MGRKTTLMVVAFLILFTAITVNTVQGIENASGVRATERQLALTVQESAATRVVTVKQRCGLTQDVENITRLDRNILLHFVPPKYGQAVIVAPYDKQLTVLAKSYAGCEVQLKQVIAISKHTPKP